MRHLYCEHRLHEFSGFASHVCRSRSRRGCEQHHRFDLASRPRDRHGDYDGDAGSGGGRQNNDDHHDGGGRPHPDQPRERQIRREADQDEKGGGARAGGRRDKPGYIQAEGRLAHQEYVKRPDERQGSGDSDRNGTCGGIGHTERINTDDYDPNEDGDKGDGLDPGVSVSSGQSLDIANKVRKWPKALLN